MNRAPLFPTKFTAPAVAGVAQVAAAYQLATYLAGTNTEADTYADEAGSTTNANPIELDENGECDLFLDPALIYKFVLLLPVTQGSGEVRVYDDVVPCAGTTDVVTSVNDLTGAVTLTAEDVPYTPTDSLDWYAVASVSEALDALAGHFTDITAEDVPIIDAGDYFTEANVEGALQEIGAQLSDAAAGRFLRLTVVNATGNWTAGADTGNILVKALGGGGGGHSFSGAANGGGGGGAGGYCERYISTPTSPSLVTVGAGGAAGIDGEDTVFGAYLTAGGGKGSVGTGGEGGTCTGGDLNLKGGGGGGGTEADSNRIYGAGGNSHFGGGARGIGAGGSGSVGAAGTGGGGGGGIAGGAGGSGIVLVYEYT